MAKKLFAIFCTCFLLGMIFIMPDFNSSELTPKQKISKSDDSTDWYAHGIDSIATNSAGLVTERLAAEKMIHYKNYNYTNIYKPQIRLYAKEEPSWQLTANRARTFHQQQKIKQINLWHEVKIQQQAKNHPNLTLSTKDLTIYPNVELAKTASFVTITSPGHKVVGRDVLIDFNKKTLKFNHQVRSLHETS